VAFTDAKLQRISGLPFSALSNAFLRVLLKYFICSKTFLLVQKPF